MEGQAITFKREGLKKVYKMQSGWACSQSQFNFIWTSNNKQLPHLCYQYLFTWVWSQI